MQQLVIAHRTCPRNAPENSLAGIVQARQLGADAVEMDVRRTADGEPLLLHDRWLLRTTGCPMRLNALDSRRARRIALIGGGTVPTLAEGLAALGPTMMAALDVKDAGAGAAVISEVRNQGLEGRVLFWSKYESAIRVAAATAPELEIALLRDTQGPAELRELLTDVEGFGARAISAHWSQVTVELAETCNRTGIRLYSWCKRRTIDSSKLVLIDGLVTDWPAEARVAIDALR